MSSFLYCMLVANVYIACSFVRLKSNPIYLWGFGTFWMVIAFFTKFMGW